MKRNVSRQALIGQQSARYCDQIISFDAKQTSRSQKGRCRRNQTFDLAVSSHHVAELNALRKPDMARGTVGLRHRRLLG